MNQLKSKLSEISITDLVNIGDVITYLYDSRGDIDIWRKAEILDIFNSEILTEEKYNPYLKLNIELGRDNYINVEIPKTIWKSKISLNNRYKSTAGSKVSFKSGASDFLRRKYGEDMYHYLNCTATYHAPLKRRIMATKECLLREVHCDLLRNGDVGEEHKLQ